MAAMVESARRLGLGGLALTEHAEWYPGDEAYGYLDLDAYFRELSAVRTTYGDRMAILAGVELGNPHEFPEAATTLVQQWPFDLVIGSLHWLDGLPGWTSEIFERVGIEATCRRYFDDLLVMVAQADYDILGHIDLVRRDVWDLFQHVLDLGPYTQVIDQVLRIVIERGQGLEVNTSGLRKGLTSPVPGLEILRRYRALGGEILVFGSDGHRPAHIGYGFDVARDLARAAGFDRVAVFQHRRISDWIDL